MKRKQTMAFIKLIALFILISAPIQNSGLISQPTQIGKGAMKFLGQKIFDAICYAPNGIYSKNGEVALSLTYNLNLNGKDIVKASLEEMQKQNKIKKQTAENWRSALIKIIPNVKKGDTITGIRDKSGTSHFYKNNKYLGSISDKEFGVLFFNIWLGEKTSQPELRKKLLGLA